MEVHPFLVIVLGILVHKTEASLGDSIPNYKTCVKECRTAVCDEDGYYYKDNVSLPFYIKLLWRCNDNCQYECMWDTVNTFLDKGWLPPQFHGKWPFARWLGIQEPASAIFSLANMSIHLKMFKQFLKEMRPSNPMYKIWVFYALCSINGWFWSAVFHTRDLPFTELMDYLSAFGMVLYTSYTVGMRLLLKFHPLYSLVFSAMCLGYYFNHAAYLSVGMFDYRYNIIANLMAGVILIICSIIFILAHWKTHPQCRSLGIAIILFVVCSVSLEMIGFSPFFWILDAHATWHLTTAPAVYYFWKFILEDSRGLQKETLRATSGSADQDIDLELVRDGTPCGTNLICVNQTCSSLFPFINPVGKCPNNNNGECSKHGACNNVNKCQYEPGWSGPDCSMPVVIPNGPIVEPTNPPTEPPSGKSDLEKQMNKKETAYDKSNDNTLLLVFGMVAVVSGVFIIFALMAVCYRFMLMPMDKPWCNQYRNPCGIVQPLSLVLRITLKKIYLTMAAVFQKRKDSTAIGLLQT